MVLVLEWNNAAGEAKNTRLSNSCRNIYPYSMNYMNLPTNRRRFLCCKWPHIKKKFWKTHNLRAPSNLYARRKGPSVTDVIICRQIWKWRHLYRSTRTSGPQSRIFHPGWERGAGNPRKIGSGSAARFPKPLAYLWLKSAIFPTLLMAWPKICPPLPQLL